MPNTDELRDLIQQVEAKGGPLRINSYGDVRYGPALGAFVHWHSLDEARDQDVLAGVLRRSLVAVGLHVTHTERAHGAHRVDAVLPPVPDEALYAGRYHVGYGPGALTAHLVAWLSAHDAGLVGRRTPPRDDLYDGRMPLDDDD